jgi:hypothetical protein
VLIALNGLGRIGAGLFACAPGCAAPEDPVQRLHSQAATVAFLAIAAAALLGSVLFRSARGMQALGLYSLATGIAGLLFLGLMSAGEGSARRPLRAPGLGHPQPVGAGHGPAAWLLAATQPDDG